MEYWEHLFLGFLNFVTWDDVHYYGLLGAAIVGAFLVRRTVVQFFLNLPTPFAKEPLSKAAREGFARPLEFSFVAIVAIVVIKMLPPKLSTLSVYNIFWTIVLLNLFWILDRMTNLYSGKLQKLYMSLDAQLSRELAKLITNIVKALIATICMFTIMDLWGVNVAALLGGLGILSAAIAFASQDTIKNVFGSFTVLADETFSVGDRIAIDNIEGNVEDIGLRSTAIRRADQSLVTIPNGNLVSAPVTNFSRVSHRMVQLSLNFDFDTETSVLRQFIEQVKQYVRLHAWYTNNHTSAPLLVYVDQIQSEGVVVVVRFFIAKTDYESLCLAKEDILLQCHSLAQSLGLKFYQDVRVGLSTIRPQ